MLTPDHIATINAALEADSEYWQHIASECTADERAEHVRQITEAQAAVAKLQEIRAS